MQIILETFETVTKENVVEIDEKFRKELREKVRLETSNEKIEEVLNDAGKVKICDIKGAEIYRILIDMLTSEVEKNNFSVDAEEIGERITEYGNIYTVK